MYVSKDHVDGTVTGVKKAESILDTGEPLGPKEKFISKNSKVGLSVNFPHLRTCLPTTVCEEICYGAIRGKPITWDASLLKYLRNYHYIIKETPETVAEKIVKEFKAQKKYDFMRWNGVGDMFPASVKVLNYITNKYPEITIWAVTRKPKMVNNIQPGPNLYLMFSLDKSSLDRKAAVEQLGEHPRLYYSYLRVDLDDSIDIDDVKIVFNAKQKKGEFVDLIRPEQFLCPVDSGQIKTRGACAKCRACFNERLLE